MAATQDPSPGDYGKLIILSAIAVVIAGFLVLIFMSAVAGIIISLLGAVFGLASQVSRNTKL